MLRHEVHDRFAAQVHFAVLLATAENRLTADCGQAELVAPPGLAGKTKLRAAGKRQVFHTQRMPRGAENNAVAALRRIRQRDTLRFAHSQLDRAARGLIFLLLPHGDGKGRILRVPHELAPVKTQCPAAVYASFKHVSSLHYALTE